MEKIKKGWIYGLKENFGGVFAVFENIKLTLR